MDKRVFRTKESIKTAFMQLMLENELEKITVSEITHRANVNRSTFYLHYSDIPSVISDIEKEFADEISVRIEKFDVTDISKSIFEMFSYLTDLLEKDVLTKKYLIYSTDAVNVTNRLKIIFVEKTSAALSEEYPDLSRKDIIYPLTYAAAGIIESYVRWVKDCGENSVDLEELIREVGSYTENIISSITVKSKSTK